jgi:hypothetical protein
MRRQPPFALAIAMLLLFTITGSVNRNPLLPNKSNQVNNRADTFTRPAELWVSRLMKAIDTPGHGIDVKVRSRIKNKIKQEIAVLRTSSQLYHTIQSKELIDSAHTSFDSLSRQIIITLPDTIFRLALLGHELYHAYQFDVGLMNIGCLHTDSAGRFIKDKTDERRAYRRQKKLGDTVKGKERNLKGLRSGFHSIYNTSYEGQSPKKLMADSNFYQLDNIAKMTRRAYRAKIKGVWFTFPLTKNKLDSINEHRRIK